MQPTPPTPPAVPTAPDVITITKDGAITRTGPDGASPQLPYQALLAQNSELRDQLRRFEQGALNRGATDDGWIAIWIVFTLFVLAPIAFAYARRLWKRPAASAAAIPREVTERLEAVSQAVESIAIEVERIGEGQRFITRVLGERSLGASAAPPIAVPLELPRETPGVDRA